ncbi:hypothetical protein B9479_005616 [Cryptococcus floricola]|uniref:Uncharacterized protein n=1 Tax=Cryptococcus floricola TaxID=2591691 RepID=A0A5D3AVE0_9TREE|nr:hypothetical protein B9479_005616 [Cryptococcus floricola]
MSDDLQRQLEELSMNSNAQQQQQYYSYGTTNTAAGTSAPGTQQPTTDDNSWNTLQMDSSQAATADYASYDPFHGMSAKEYAKAQRQASAASGASTTTGPNQGVRKVKSKPKMRRRDSEHGGGSSTKGSKSGRKSGSKK